MKTVEATLIVRSFERTATEYRATVTFDVSMKCGWPLGRLTLDLNPTTALEEDYLTIEAAELSPGDGYKRVVGKRLRAVLDLPDSAVHSPNACPGCSGPTEAPK